jgi:RNA polymerase sigma factor (TIGR02999 family)
MTAGTKEPAMESEQFSILLERLNGGDTDAFEPLVSVAYLELRKIAGAVMRTQRNGHTLQPTALVNEAYLRLASSDGRWENRAHFFGAAARAMRQVLIGYARQKSAQKRAGAFASFNVDNLGCGPGIGMNRLDEALTALGRVDPELLRVMELRYFGGRSLKEVADLLGCSLATVKRRWTYARAWLYDFMNT